MDGGIPKKVSNWNLNVLDDIGVQYSCQGSIDPVDVLNIKDKVGPLAKDYELALLYLAKCINFEIKPNKLNVVDLGTGEMRANMLKKLTDTLDSNSENLVADMLTYIDQLQPDSEQARVRCDLFSQACVGGKEFIKHIQEYLMAVYLFEPVYKSFLTDLIGSFARMLNLLVQSGATYRRKLPLGDTDVVSVPDLRFVIPKRIKKGRKAVQTTPMSVIVTVVENSMAVQSQMGSDATVTENKDFDIHDYLGGEILAQHCGELLSEWKHSCITPHGVVGLIVCGTKVIVTSLACAEHEYFHILEHGRVSGTALTINYSKPLDLFLHEERNTLCLVFYILASGSIFK